MKRLLPWVAGLLLGVVIGRFTMAPIDNQDLRDSLAVYRADRKTNERTRDSLNQAIVGRDQRIVALEDSALFARTRAALAEGRSRVHGRAADSLAGLLARASTPAESLAACLPALEARVRECAELRTANSELHMAVLADSMVKDSLKTTIRDQRQIITTDSTNLVRADRLVTRLERVAWGCRLPLIELRCPVAVANYDLSNGLSVGGGFPVTKWLTLTLTTPVARRAPVP